MPRLDVNNAVSSDYTNYVKDYAVKTAHVDGVSEQDETYWDNSNWPIQWGYFNNVAELNTAILMKAVWNVGKGWIADPETTVILQHISGWGKDTFDDVIFNLDVVRQIGGDSFAEIIRDEKTKTLLNLKPLDPGSMRIVVNKMGMIIRYEQVSKIKGAKNKTFTPDRILHLSNNRLADQIHGLSKIDPLIPIILADQESFFDMKQIEHRGARPMILWKLKTDDTTKIQAFVRKINNARNLGEDMFIPDDEDTVTHEIVQVDVSGNAMAWRTDMRNKFYRAVGLPQIIFGSAGTTESGGKIEYLAHEQVFERDQRYLENQIMRQLGLKINLVPPTTLLENLQQDEAKDANQGLEVQPSDVTPGSGR